MAIEDISFNTGKQYYAGGPQKRSNHRLAKQYFNKAITLNPNHANSLYYLGMMEEKGQDTAVNIERAKEFYSKAAIQGHPPAMSRLLDLHKAEIDTAEDWNALGEKYYREKNYALAHACYLEAIEIDATHSESLFSLGWLHQYKQGTTLDLDLAKKYYFRAMTHGHEEAKTRLYKILLDTASGWYELGEEFFRDESLTGHYGFAYSCYQNALKKTSKHDESLYSLGWLYHYGLGVKTNLKRAEEFYCKAIAANHIDAQAQLLIIYNDRFKNAQDWTDLGKKFYYGTEAPQSHAMARQCYARAIKIDPNNSDAHYSLGCIYERGEGVTKNLKTATEYYRQAASLGHADAKKFILLQDNAKLTAAGQWYELGMQYFEGNNDFSKDAYLARLCFEEALKYNAKHQPTLTKLGFIHENGLAVPIDLKKAREYYEKLIDKKLHLKRVEKKRVQLLLEQNQSVDKRDQDNRTAMHRAALDNNLKLFSTLKLLNAKTDILDADQNTPGNYLTDKQRIQVTSLQILASESFRKMNLSAPKVIASRIVFQNGNHDEDATLLQLEELYKNEDLKPLFDLAKLAMLGKHKLSRRPIVVQDGYDSDEEEPAKEDERLRITIDPDNKNVNGLVCTADGHKTSVGVYIHKLNNTLFIGGNRDKQRVIGTLIHELTHFIAREINGSALPYATNDKLNEARFKKICDDMKKLFEEKKNRDPALKPNLFEITFTSYTEDQYHSELIARIAQSIAQSNNQPVNLSKPEQELLKYYREIFLKKVSAHVKKLTEKAYGGWSPQVFKPMSQNTYHLDIDEEADQAPTITP